MRKFFAAAAAVLAALFLLPVLLVRGEPLVGVGMSEIPEGAEKVGGRVSFEPSTAPSVEPSVEPNVTRSKSSYDFSHAAYAAPAATLAPVTSVPNEPSGESEPDDAEDETPPPGAVAVYSELEGIEGESEASKDVARSTGQNRSAISPTQSDLSHAADAAATINIVGEGEMALEDYVAGVVAAEMGPSFPTEARRAQAVAARSLALYRVNHPKHGDAAVCLDAGCCMAWKTPDEGALDAAQSTEGVVATYDGEPIMAAFFSGSDGATLSAAEVWGGGVPYLVSVESPWETGDRTRGHGVGMSQYGAAGMADGGADYDEILRHYYTGIEVG